jgi:hypothetical protein
MPSSWRVALLCSIALAPGALAAENGKPQKLTSHHPAHAAPVSVAPLAVKLPAPAKRYGGTPIDVLGYHYDNDRTGWNQSETDLTPASVASSNFGLLTTLAVDGNVFAQPLLVTNFTLPDKSTHDVLIVVTGHDSVYAFDAQTYAVLWQVSLGTSQSTSDVGCGDVKPEYGISSTPVIVRKGKKATIYLVAATEPSHMNFLTQLHALDLGTGADVMTPVTISPSATLSNGSTINFDPQNQWSRASLAISKKDIYIGISSHCDHNSGGITGWMLRYNTSLNLESAFHTIETPAGGTELASIWMTGFAPAIDSAGHIFTVTGNGDFSGKGKDWGESVLELPPGLTGVTGRFTPSSYNNLNNNDTDFGSGGVMLLPPVSGQTAPPLAVAMGKDATLYLLNQTRLGGEKPGDAGALQAQRVGGSGAGVWGGPAFYNSPASGPLVYYQINGDVLRSYAVATGAKPALTQFATGTSGAGYGGSLPIVSSNGAGSGTGVVWLIRRSAPISMEAYNADALGKPLYTATVGNWSNPGQSNPFLTPMQANGRLYVPAYKTVSVFGLTQ